MAGEWRKVKLGEIARTDNGLVDGPFGSNLPASDYACEGIPVIRGSNLSLGETRFRGSEYVFVSEATAQRLSRSLCEPDDIVFTKKGTLGQTGIIPQDSGFRKFLLSSNQMRLSVDRHIANPMFVYYYVSSPSSRKKIIQDSTVTGVPKTNLAYLRDFQISLPPLDEQNAIARILGSLDDKIELNRKMNETLEAMARALFTSWFVDFDPVRAKAEGRDPGLPAHIAGLFPDSFQDSELGAIPKGWYVGKLSDLCSTQYGYTASASKEPVGPRFLRVMDINKQNWIEWDDVPHCVADSEAISAYSLKVGDLVVARMADPGKSAIVEEKVDAVFASYLVRLKTQSLSDAYFVYGFLKSDLYAEYSAGARSGSVQANMNARVIVAASMVVPPVPLREAFLKTILPIRQRLAANVRDSRSLSCLRDLLLPKFISGELRLPILDEEIAG